MLNMHMWTLEIGGLLVTVNGEPLKWRSFLEAFWAGVHSQDRIMDT